MSINSIGGVYKMIARGKQPDLNGREWVHPEKNGSRREQDPLSPLGHMMMKLFHGVLSNSHNGRQNGKRLAQ